MLRCRDGSIYTGIATDVNRRLEEHGSSKRGAKYLRGRGPFILILEYSIGSRSHASKIEHQLKSLSGPEKRDTAGVKARIEKMLREFQA